MSARIRAGGWRPFRPSETSPRRQEPCQRPRQHISSSCKATSSALSPLIPGQIYSLGRAASNRVILSGDKCSRIHAEIAYADEHWRVRDLNSANGTKVNSIAIQGDHELAFNDN